RLSLTTTTITSLHNERVKRIHALQLQSKLRRKEKRIVLEGVRLIGDAAAAGVLPEFVLYTPGAAPDQPVAQWIVRFHEQGVAALRRHPTSWRISAIPNRPRASLLSSR